MSASTITVPAGFSYVPAAFLFTALLLTWQNVSASRYRRLSGIAYPRAYADKSETDASPYALKFNCAQRTLQYTLGALPIMSMLTLITSIKYPLIGAGGLTLWTFTRIVYTFNYRTGNPSRRGSLVSSLVYPDLAVLLGSSAYTVFQLIQEGL